MKRIDVTCGKILVIWFALTMDIVVKVVVSD